MTFLPNPGELSQKPLILALHFLGGSAQTWRVLASATSEVFDWQTLDLPGFGQARDQSGYSVDEMAAAVVETVKVVGSRRWFLAGHSMGAKVACAVARAVENGAPRIEGLSGLVLLAGSPPSPEPMTETKRITMLGWFKGDAAQSRAQAHGFVQDNVGEPLAPVLHAGAVDDVLRAHPAAWTAWLTRGSREDWSSRIGVLVTPAMVVAGEKDEALGPASQAQSMLPHLADATLHVLAGAGHLLPLERADAIAKLMTAFASEQRREPTIAASYAALIASPRVSPRTRDILVRRAEVPQNGDDALSPDLLDTLRAVLDRILPQTGPNRLDLAARFLLALSGPQGDGWRFACLPPDIEALRAGLATIDQAARVCHDRVFGRLAGADQDELLKQAAEGALVIDNNEVQARQMTSMAMKLWFEDLRSAATQAYVAHPATLGRIGYSGIANRGEPSGPQGFVHFGEGIREDWEPAATGEAAR